MTHNIEDFVDLCLKQAGKHYVWGAAGPNSFDCSGMVMWCASQLGIQLPHYSGSQYNAIHHISVFDAKKTRGALIFEGAGGGQHVVVSLGNGQTIEARSAHMTPNIGSWSVDGRPWTVAGLIPGFVYPAVFQSPHPLPKPSDWPGIYFRYIKDHHMQGSYVAYIQTRLVHHGWNGGTFGIDADYGLETVDAVEHFQQRKHLTVDGTVGPYTWSALAKT